MIIPTVVDLQGFIVEKRFRKKIIKEIVMLKQETVLTHFYKSCAMEIFDKIDLVLSD